MNDEEELCLQKGHMDEEKDNGDRERQLRGSQQAADYGDEDNDQARRKRKKSSHRSKRKRERARAGRVRRSRSQRPLRVAPRRGMAV